MIEVAQSTYVVPTGDGRRAAEAYKGLARLMRQRPKIVNSKENEGGCIERSVAVLRSIVHATLKGHFALEEYSPMVPQRNDSSLINTTFVTERPLPDGPYQILPVKAGDVLRAQYAPSWVASDHRSAYERSMSELVWQELLASLCDMPGALLSRTATSGVDLVSSATYQEIRSLIDAFMGVYFPTFHACIAGFDQSKLSRNEVRRRMLLEVTSRAGIALRIALTELVCLVVARRWEAVKRFMPLLTYLSNHAIIGVRGSTVLVLYG